MANQHGIQWEYGFVPYSKAKHLITMAVMGATNEEGTSSIVYVKGNEKREWLQKLLEEDARDEAYIENIDIHYEEIDALNKLDIANTLCCGKHDKNCALQNVFKLFNWSNHQK